jgi:hypothetical protein
MQTQMQQLLAEQGWQGRQGARRQQQLLAALSTQGARPMEPITVSRWSVASTPEQSLVAWQQKPGLGGNDLPESLKLDILATLRTWAEAQFGDLQQPVASEEAYVLQGVWLSMGERSPAKEFP